MTPKTPNFPPVSGFMRQLSLSLLLPFSRRPDSGPAPEQPLHSSVFSRPDQSELLAMEEEICPLVEAEVYLIYGRKADAVRVLAQGTRIGRITADDVTHFWLKYGNEAGKPGSN